MQSPPGLEQFLTELQAEGRQDSSGQFTLSLEKARQKLASARLEPGHYILKFVQAAIRAGASRVDLRMERGNLRLIFGTREAPFTPEAVLEHLSSAQLPDDPMWRHFVLGVTACLGESSCYRIRWAHWTPDEDGSCVDIQQDSTRGYSNPPCPKPPECEHRNCFGLWVYRKQSTWFRAATRAEWLAINQRCKLSPASIWLDGRRLEPELPNPVPKRIGLSPDVRGPLRVLAFQPSDYRYDWANGCWRRPGFWGESQVFGTNNGTGLPIRCQSMVSLSHNSRKPSELRLVLDGVELDPVAVPSGKGHRAYYPAGDDLTTDLSEFGVVENAVCEEYRQRAIRAWKSLSRADGRNWRAE